MLGGGVLLLLIGIWLPVVAWAQPTGNLFPMPWAVGVKARALHTSRFPGGVLVRGTSVKGDSAGFTRSPLIDAVVLAMGRSATAVPYLSLSYASEAWGASRAQVLGWSLTNASAAAQFQDTRPETIMRELGAHIMISLALSHVVEYVEVNGVPGFQGGDDRTLGWYRLKGAQLGPVSCTELDVIDEVNGVPRVFASVVCNVHTTDRVLHLRAFLAGAPVRVGTLPLVPDVVKLDVFVKYYNSEHRRAAHTTGPSAAVDGAAAQLALVALVRGRVAGSHDDDRSSLAWPPMRLTNGSVSFTLDSSSPGGQPLAGAHFRWGREADVIVRQQVVSRPVVAQARVADVTAASGLDLLSPGSLLANGNMSDLLPLPGNESRALIVWWSFGGHRPQEVAFDGLELAMRVAYDKDNLVPPDPASPFSSAVFSTWAGGATTGAGGGAPPHHGDHQGADHNASAPRERSLAAALCLLLVLVALSNDWRI